MSSISIVNGGLSAALNMMTMAVVGFHVVGSLNWLARRASEGLRGSF